MADFDNVCYSELFLPRFASVVKFSVVHSDRTKKSPGSFLFFSFVRITFLQFCQFQQCLRQRIVFTHFASVVKFSVVHSDRTKNSPGSFLFIPFVRITFLQFGQIRQCLRQRIVFTPFCIGCEIFYPVHFDPCSLFLVPCPLSLVPCPLAHVP